MSSFEKVAELYRKGLRQKEIAAKLGLNKSTVSRHVKKLKAKEKPAPKKVAGKPSDELKLARVLGFDHVPVYLLEQSKGRNWEVEGLLKWGNLIASSPFEMIYVMVTRKHEVKGVVWATANPLADAVFLNLVSVDKEYQDGLIIKKITGFFKAMLKDMGLNKVMALTSRPRAGIRHGWKKTGIELMEV